MKTILIVLLALSSVAFAKDKGEVEPVSVHVQGSLAGDLGTGFVCSYELRINNLFYLAEHRGRKCDDVVRTGMDFPAVIEKDHIRVLKGNKELSLRITGTHE